MRIYTDEQKAARKIANRNYYLTNKEKLIANAKERLNDPVNKEKHNASQRLYYTKNIKQKVNDGYYVYYLPEEHYCGITNNLYQRESSHRNTAGKNTNNMTILFHSMDRNIAAHHEAMFQSVLGIGGLNYV
jgi:predicted GIY-YIG superfamily endonuclease